MLFSKSVVDDIAGLALFGGWGEIVAWFIELRQLWARKWRGSWRRIRLSRLIERVLAGEDVIIARRGKPVARLVAIGPPPPRRPGLLSGRVEDSFLDPLADDELDA